MSRRVHPSTDGDEYGLGGNTYRVGEHRDGDALHVGIDLVYPSYDDRKSMVTVGLEAVRAVDSFRVWFSMQRNCWVVEMQPTRDAGGCMDVCGDWREVTTIPAWLEAGPDERCQHPGSRSYRHQGTDICGVCGEVLQPSPLP